MSRPTELITMLEDVWSSLDSLLATLNESQWKTATELPGWSVQDTLSHLVSSEKGLHGEPGTAHRASNLSNVKNPIGEFNEHEVDARRSLPGATVFTEWKEIQAKRRNTFATADDAYFAREMMTPTGPGTFADFLHIRVMDAWVHEQDIRRAIGKPGNQGGAAARHSLSRFVRSLPMVVGKRAKAPDGSTVTLRITGAVQADFHVATEAGRAKLVEVAPQPLCVISIDSEAYFAMCCGRQFWKPGDPRVAVSGDTELAGRVLSNFNVMI
ncbi:MAG: maleylpyruvate isomerase family mycothiol-dependent enzyme [Ilumatobacteraceae bacterium]|jgi:uncharacterized protein (TIGR03083 family)